MKVVVLGGDGFCGWPTALKQSALGNEVLIIDNLSRRSIDQELGINSLTPIESPAVRHAAWEEISGRRILFEQLDVAKDYTKLLYILKEFQPNSIVHFAEQRSVPYSMFSSNHKRYTVNNNINATHNVLVTIAELGIDVHLVHLGSMGVYGYETTGHTIPEGYIDVTMKQIDGAATERKIPYPSSPGSIYHMTKALDAEMFRYFSHYENIRITDLHQGIVWGTQTDETVKDARLINRFDYDGIYGTVLNRFLMQAAQGIPLTVHGTGGQTRAFIHINDTVKCIDIALRNPPKNQQHVMVRNQMAESRRVRELAEIISAITGTSIAYIPNPRDEADENDFLVSNHSLTSLGFTPTRLNDGLLNEVTDIAKRYINRIDTNKINAKVVWRKKQ
ncbi:NAD-dependent epimerase/dehydratase family protein [Xenorhabdus bovienii]|uniref:NAD-dependent epimerase/dehydratase family protein n=1 Tax=Xenorhabdus bovienii TaxID=40576 RepID=UPI0023B2ACCD|nr:NAD-dependent epimerase/dehydratase family protein [Xenorhabdus bovienii]MDE9566543.1 NAD-dependent epimerase/dehydratase family protein [Xenorhabdus bovienii]